MKIVSHWMKTLMIMLFYKRHLLILIIKKSLGKNQRRILFFEKNKSGLGVKVMMIIKTKNNNNNKNYMIV